MFRFTRWRVGLLAAMLVAAPALAADKPPEAPPAMPGTTVERPTDLLEIYRLAEKNDPRFLAAEARYRADKEKFPQAIAFALPQLSGTGERVHVNDEVRTDGAISSRPTGKAEYDATRYDLSATQTIFNWGFFKGIKQANQQVKRAEYDYASARQDLMVRSAVDYFAVLAAQDNVEVNVGEREANKRQLELVEARLQVGMSTSTDYNDALARYQLAAAAVIQAENTLSDQREALREITGRYIARVVRLGDDLPIVTPDPPDVNKWLETARNQNLRLLARRESVEIANSQIGIERSGHFPSVDLVGTKSYSDSDGSISGPGIRTESTEYGLKMNVPIFQGGYVNSKTTEAAALFTAAQQEAEQEQRAAERATRAAYLGVTTAGARLGALKQAVVASDSALKAKQEGYEAGINTNIDVLDAQRDLYIAQRNYLVARYQYIVDLLRLKFAAGTLSEDDLARASKWLEQQKLGPPAAEAKP